jgi:hypothetical protein
MKTALFKPFDLHKWFVVGFNAFLAGLAEASNGSGGGRARGRGHISFGEFLDFPGKAWGWLTAHPGWFVAIIFGAMVLIVVGILVLWLSSRGKFMFLDNVVHNRAEIAKPWKQFRTAGDSLFLWRLIFTFAIIAVMAAFVVLFFVTARGLYFGSNGDRIPWPFMLGAGFFFLSLFIVIGYISTFLNDFVVPMMYKNGITATQGWSRFLSLFGRYPFYFLLYGLFIFLLMILFVIVVIVAGLVTCCFGWLLLVIPYIGTVVTLPVWYTFRAFSLEFLRQFGPEYELFPAPEPQPAA